MTGRPFPNDLSTNDPLQPSDVIMQTVTVAACPIPADIVKICIFLYLIWGFPSHILQTRMNCQNILIKNLREAILVPSDVKTRTK